jgi:group I intron endonuclease
MAHIYKITSPSKKVYVGSTTNIKARFSCYKALKCKTQTRLYNSFLKYGVLSHKFEIITECENDKMYELECYFGNLYNTLSKNGLNCVLPNKDDKFVCRSFETRQKLSKSNTGKKISDETKEKLRLINLGKESKNKGRKHTKEAISKMKKSHTGKVLSNSHKENIRIKHKGKTPKNFIESIKGKRAKLIIDNNYGIFHESIKQAANFYGVSASLISFSLVGKRINRFNLSYV